MANRHDRMDILKRHMERDPRVRMEYSDAYFGLSNYADYAKWENKCLRRFDVVSIREAEEERLQRWIEADSARKAEDGRCSKSSPAVTRRERAPSGTSTISVRHGSAPARRCSWPTACRRTSVSSDG